MILRRRPTFRVLLGAVLALAAGLALPANDAHAAVPAPEGLTGIALDDRVVLAWNSVPGATGYRVYRGNSPTTVTSLIGSTVQPRFNDTSLPAGQTSYYAVRAEDLSGPSPASTQTLVTGLDASCSSSEPIVAENCLPGTRDWTPGFVVSSQDGGIEGFATAPSIEAGESVDLKIDVGAGTPPPIRIEIYRNGWYGGDQGRLVAKLPDRTGTNQPACDSNATTGEFDCSNWSTSATINTTTDWPTGVYVIKFVREDSGHDNQLPLVVRDDSRNPDLLYKLPVATYQAYNFYGGKSLYDSFSEGANTISGGPRAVEVSFDRPYVQSRSNVHWYSDWYGRTDQPLVSWLERQGYDISYTTDVDVHLDPSRPRDAKVLVNGIHDEYWTAEMRAAAEQARDAGVSIVFPGANSVYWKTRMVASHHTGAPGRVLICYKTTAGGPVDPSGQHTGTWRDPAGINQPENSLVGSWYIGDSGFAPIRVSAAEGRDRFWRHTPAANQAAGSSMQIGERLIGWEWDARADNGREPAGIVTLASSPVAGNLLTDAGRIYTTGSAVSHITRYRAASGAFVWASGTNNWSTGLARNELDGGEPNAIIQQATLNLLTDMGVQPSTPAPGMVTEPPGPPVVTGHTPASGATGVSTKASPSVLFDRSIDPFSLNNAFTLTGPDGNAVEATTSWDEDTKTATLDPAAQLDAMTSYTAQVTTGIRSWSGATLVSPLVWSFTTGAGEPPEVASTAPADNATNVPVDTTVRARFDRQIDPATITSSSFQLRNPGGQLMPAALTYDAATRHAILTPTAPLAASTRYTAQVTTAVRGADGAPLLAAASWSFTTGTTLDITRRLPAQGATGVSPDTAVRAEFARAVDPATLTTTTFSLRAPDGSSVAATVSYNAATRVASLIPNAALAVSTQYTARLAGVRAVDGSPLAGTQTSSFTTAATPPPPPAVSSRTPANTATEVDTRTAVTAVFDRALDADSLDSQSFVLRDPANQPVAATVTYDASTRTATLQPSAPLGLDRVYTAQLTTQVRGADGARLATLVQWSFRTASCPCTLYADQAQPAVTGLDVRDGRPGAGPFSYELGTKITVSAPMELVALRYWRDPGETGSHIGRVWASSGTELATTTFRNESASGWQRQALAEPVTLEPGQNYVISVGFNTRFGLTARGFATPVSNGPLSSAVGVPNGVYGSSAGTFPSQSWNSSSYYVDAVVADPTGVRMVPHVSAMSPANGAANVAPRANISATFDVRMDASTIDGETVFLTAPDGSRVPAAVSYDSGTRTVTIDPASSLELSTTYTASLTTGIRSHDGSRLPARVDAAFTIAPTAPPEVDEFLPAGGATGVAVDAAVRVRFDRALDPSSLTEQSFALRTSSGAAVAATRSYDTATRTAILTPTATLAGSSNYVAEVTSGIRGADGTPKTATEAWGFRTGDALEISRRTPAPLAGGISPQVAVRAAFSRSVDPATITAATFGVTDSGGAPVPGAVAYNPETRVATFTPNAELAAASSYTARVLGVRATDGQPLAAPSVWTFSTALDMPPAPAPTSFSPAAGAVDVAASTRVRITFDRALDPDSIDSASLRLRAADGSVLAATATIDATGRTLTLRPSASLSLHSGYTVEVSTAVRSAEGSRLAAALTWQFSTGGCPCSVWADQDSPLQTGLPTRDGRAGNPMTYELGTRLTVDTPTEIVALRYWRDPAETGSHVGRVWSSGGAQLASTTFAGETASGWQRQRLGGPLLLQPGETYTVSVGFNNAYGMTRYGLENPLATGPLRTAAGPANGVFADAAGAFPDRSWNSSAYFVDAVVRVPSETRRTPAVSAVTPLAGSSEIPSDTSVTATFSTPLDATTINTGSFRLRGAGASSDVPATVTYDGETQVATLRPQAPLLGSTTYTATLTTAIRSDDDTQLPAAYEWSFVTIAGTPPSVTATSPSNGAADVAAGAAITATFSQALDPSTVTGSSFTLTGPSGAIAANVSYDDVTRTARLQPAAPLAMASSYTARLGAGIASATGVPLGTPYTWTFSTPTCPCSLFSTSATPASGHNDVADGRGAGDWSYELGAKFEVTSPTSAIAVRFFKDSGEGGVHQGRIWTADGTLLASVTFSGETGSGWQEQSLATPLSLVPGQTYVVSVNFNDYYSLTYAGLAGRIDRGPLSSIADGANGVFAGAAGVFPTGSWGSSNYFVDVVVG